MKVTQAIGSMKKKQGKEVSYRQMKTSSGPMMELRLPLDASRDAP